MPLQNTFKDQRKLQNKYEKALEIINELPMAEESRTDIIGILLAQFKQETKKIVDDKTDISDELESEVIPHMVVIHDVVPPSTSVSNTTEGLDL